MARRFLYPEWPGADGDTVVNGDPINGVSGPMWPLGGGKVYKTLAAVFAAGENTIYLPYGYRLTPPADGRWIGTFNQIEAGTILTIRAYDAGQGARDPEADGKARARIRAAAHNFDETEFRAGAADCHAAMNWPIIDFGYYTTSGEWSYVGAGSGGHIWRAIFPWTRTSADDTGVLVMRVGARAPTNKTADMVLGTMSQQAYTQGDMSPSPDYQASESVGVWHSYRSNVSGVATSGGSYTTVLIVLPVPSVDPVTYHNGIMLVGTNNPEAAILVRNGGSLDAEDIAIYNCRDGIDIGNYTNTTRNGQTLLRRVHVSTMHNRAFQVHSSASDVVDCGDVQLFDCSFDSGANVDCVHDVDESTEGRSLASAEGFSVEQRGNNVLIDGGWGVGGWHNALSIQWSAGPTDADEPHGCIARNVSLMGVSGNDRLSSINGYNNVMDGVYQFSGTTRSQHSCSGGTVGGENVIKNWRVGAGRMHSNVENESWTLAHLWSSTGTLTAPRNVGKLKYINCLIDNSNGVSKFGVMLSDGASREDWIGPNQLIVEGLTLKIAPTQECALRVCERSFNKTSSVTFDTTANRVLWTAHGLTAPAVIRFTTTGTLPTGVTAGVAYYVLNTATNDFQISATPNGAAIDLTGTPSGTHTANTTQLDRSQTFKHIRIIQESGAAVPQIGYQENKSAGSDTGMVFGTLADFFNGTTAVHHKVVQGPAATYDSGGSAGPRDREQDPPAADSDIDSWKFWINPSYSWGQAPEKNYRGEDNFVRFFTEYAGAGEASLQFVDTEDPVGTFDTGAYDTVMTATELRRDVTQPTAPTFAVIKRVTDPVDPSRMAFEYALNKTQSGWVLGEKFRNLLHVRNADIPFDTEFWAVIGIRLTPQLLLMGRNPASYIHLGQFHNGAEDMTNGPTMPIELQGGNGSPGSATLGFTVRRFINTSGLWPNPAPGEEDDPDLGTVHTGYISLAMEPDIYHYVIFNARFAPGWAPPTSAYPHYFYDGKWQNIYGPLDEAAYPGLGSAPTGFVRCYYAAGEFVDPVLVDEYKGWCSAPIHPDHSKQDENIMYRGRLLNVNAPGPHCGVYSDCPFDPPEAGNEVRIWNRGWKGWLAADNPGITASIALNSYRKSG